MAGDNLSMFIKNDEAGACGALVYRTHKTWRGAICGGHALARDVAVAKGKAGQGVAGENRTCS